MKILRQENLDGVKFYLDNPEAKTKPNAAETWLLLRASGTEPLMRIYTESCSKESVARPAGIGAGIRFRRQTARWRPVKAKWMRTPSGCRACSSGR
jgi:hypothetical protein